jgi:hypothetical protein
LVSDQNLLRAVQERLDLHFIEKYVEPFLFTGASGASFLNGYMILRLGQPLGPDQLLLRHILQLGAYSCFVQVSMACAVAASEAATAIAE